MAQWIEHPGSIPYEDSDFFLCPTLVSCLSVFTFHYGAKSSPSLFTYHTHDDFGSGDPRCMQDACHMNSVNDRSLHEFPLLSG